MKRPRGGGKDSTNAVMRMRGKASRKGDNIVTIRGSGFRQTAARRRGTGVKKRKGKTRRQEKKRLLVKDRRKILDSE